jgi:hypothetical protein
MTRVGSLRHTHTHTRARARAHRERERERESTTNLEQGTFWYSGRDVGTQGIVFMCAGWDRMSLDVLGCGFVS